MPRIVISTSKGRNSPVDARLERALGLTRRDAAKLLTVGAAVTVASPALTACGGGFASVVFGPDWLSTLTSALGAGVLTEFGKPWINTASDNVTGFFSSWADGNQKARSDQNDQGYVFVSDLIYGDAIPPVTMFAVQKGQEADPDNDRLVAVVDNGRTAVIFAPWAWQALSMFAQDLTKGRSGDDLAAYRCLCAAALTPSGVAPSDNASPSGRSELVSYQARAGSVEMNLSTDKDGNTSVQVTTFGIPTGSGGPDHPRAIRQPVEVTSRIRAVRRAHPGQAASVRH